MADSAVFVLNHEFPVSCYPIVNCELRLATSCLPILPWMNHHFVKPCVKNKASPLLGNRNSLTHLLK